MKLPRVIIAGTHSGVGKTTLTLGIILALRKRGVRVQPFKTGPDYIDPTYHTFGAGNSCGNLDTWLLSKDVLLELFLRRAEKADISIIEGVMGLFDGFRNSEQGSTSHLAKILECPVILLMNARALSRSAAAIALGYKEFDKGTNIAGIILNNIGSKNHYRYIKSAIEEKTKLPVLGYLPKDPHLKLFERHLGLIPLEEKRLNFIFYQKLAKLVEDNINLDKFLEVSRKAKPLVLNKKILFAPNACKDRLTIAIARDEAFNFYYQDNLDILSHLGARLVTFSPLRDTRLPKDIAGLYIGGGFPELFASKLSRNKRLKAAIYQKAEEGLPIFAECAGLMYLMEKIVDFKKRKFSMVGVFKGLVKMSDKRRALGYVCAEVLTDNILSKKGSKVRGHLFHWSYLKDGFKKYPYVYRIKKDKGEIFYDGLVKKNVLATYLHLHFASHLALAKNFILSCKQYKIKLCLN